MSNALVVFSGGQDSTTHVCTGPKQRFKKVYAVTFDYRQRHSLELQSAKKIAEMAGIEHEISIDIEPYFCRGQPPDRSQPGG